MTTTQSSSPDRILAAYYPSWKIYKGSKPSDLRIELLTHVYYAFSRVSQDGTVHHLDEKADCQLLVDGVEGCIAALQALKQRRNPNLRLLLSIGGGSGSANFAAVAADHIKSRRFCESARAMVDRFEFDGVDLDWEHPSNVKEGGLFVSLCAMLREFFPAPEYVVSAALPAGEWCLRNIDLAKVLSPCSHDSRAVLDFLNVMTYDFAGPWTDGQSGHHAQLHAPARPHNAFAKRSISNTTRYLISERHIDSKKLVIGIPAYGRSFGSVRGPGQKFSDSGIFEYRELPLPGSEEIVDRFLGAASCYDPQSKRWVSYDSKETVKMKAAFAVEQDLGGLFLWTVSFDAPEESRSLCVAVHSTLSGR